MSMEVPLGDTYYFKFTTRAFATGIPTTLGGTPVLSVYEENNLTQITAGVTLTADYDTVTGLNDVAVVATTGNGYEIGKYYDVVITTGTVGGVSVVGEVVGHFRVMPSEDAGAGIKDVNTTHISDTAQTANDNGADINTLLTRLVGTIAAGTHNAQTGDTYALANGAAGFVAIDTVVDAIKAVTDNLPDSGALTTLITHLTDIKGATFSGATDSLEAIRNQGDAAWLTASGFATAAELAKVPKSDGTASWNATALAAINAECDTALTDYDAATGAEVASLNNISAAQVNAEVLDVLNTDTFAEPGQEAPGATVSLATKIGYLYKAWRNKVEQTSSTYSLYDDAGTTVDQKASVSDDATTATKGEVGTGP